MKNLYRIFFTDKKLELNYGYNAIFIVTHTEEEAIKFVEEELLGEYGCERYTDLVADKIGMVEDRIPDGELAIEVYSEY